MKQPSSAALLAAQPAVLHLEELSREMEMLVVTQHQAREVRMPKPVAQQRGLEAQDSRDNSCHLDPSVRSIETLRPRERDHLHAAVSIETPEESVLKDSNYRGSRKASQRLLPFIYPTSFCAGDEEQWAGMMLQSHAALRLSGVRFSSPLTANLGRLVREEEPWSRN